MKANAMYRHPPLCTRVFRATSFPGADAQDGDDDAQLWHPLETTTTTTTGLSTTLVRRNRIHHISPAPRSSLPSCAPPHHPCAPPAAWSPCPFHPPRCTRRSRSRSRTHRRLQKTGCCDAPPPREFQSRCPRGETRRHPRHRGPSRPAGISRRRSLGTCAVIKRKGSRNPTGRARGD